MPDWALTTLAAILAASALFIWRRISEAAKDKERLKINDRLRKIENEQDSKDHDFERAIRSNSLLAKLRALRSKKQNSD